MKLGDYIKVPDGRVGTIVYNGIDGIGIVWGQHKLTKEDQDQIMGLCPLLNQKIPDDYKWTVQAMLRDKSLQKYFNEECVGDDKLCEVIGNGCL